MAKAEMPQAPSTQEKPFTADDVARILRSVPGDVALEGIERTDLDFLAEKTKLLELVELLLSGSEIQNKEVLAKLDALLAKSSTSISFNMIGLVQILPLQFKWVGILAFIIVNILANTLTPGVVATFIAALTGASVREFEAIIRGQWQNLQGDLVRALTQRDAIDALIQEALIPLRGFTQLDPRQTTAVAQGIQNAANLNDQLTLTLTEANQHLFTLLRRAEDLFARIRGFSPGS